MNALSPANWAPALSAWAVNTSLAATVLIGLALLVQWFFDRRLPVRWGYALWLLVVVRLLLPAVPASSFSIFNLRKGWEAAFPKPPPAKLAFAETPRAASPIVSCPGGRAQATTRPCGRRPGTRCRSSR